MTNTTIANTATTSAPPAVTMGDLSHVALTVTDLSVSVPWYERVFGRAPVLDEDTGPFRHVVFALGSTLFGLHAFPGTSTTTPRSTLTGRAWTTSRSAAQTASGSLNGQPGWTSSASRTARSSTPATARVSRSKTRTDSHSSCSAHPTGEPHQTTSPRLQEKQLIGGEAPLPEDLHGRGADATTLRELLG